MPSSPIRKLAPLARAAKAQGVKVYHLNIGQPDLPTPRKALEALKHIDRETLEYSPSEGYLFLREKLVNYYKKYGVDVTPDDIIITAGGSAVNAIPDCVTVEALLRASTMEAIEKYSNVLLI